MPRLRQCCLAFMLLAAAFPATAAARSSRALAEVDALFSEGRVAEALAQLRGQADRKIPEAQAELAGIYFAGVYVPKDDARAESLLRAAARASDPSHARDLACVIYHRHGAQSLPEYAALLDKAAASGDVLALAYLSRLYRLGLDRPANTVRATYLLEQALTALHRPPAPPDREAAYLRIHLPDILRDGHCGPADSSGAALAAAFPRRYMPWPAVGKRSTWNPLFLYLR